MTSNSFARELLTVAAAVLACSGIAGAQHPFQLGIDVDIEHRGDHIHVIVNRVLDRSIAQRFEIRRNEVIEMIDGGPIRSENDLRARLQIGPPFVFSIRNPKDGRLGLASGGMHSSTAAQLNSLPPYVFLPVLD